MSGLRLRWQYYDPTTYVNDWYAQIDEAALVCVANPIIDVDRDSLSSTQEPGQAETQPLTIGDHAGPCFWRTFFP